MGDTNRKKLTDWLNGWTPDSVSKKALFLEGAAGVGKTTIACCLARMFDYNIIEINASDERDLQAMKSKVEPLLYSSPLFENERNLLVVEEVDGISGTEGRGALQYLTKLIGRTAIPIILTANEWSKSLETLKKKCFVLRVHHIRTEVIAKRLFEIAEKHSMLVTENDIEQISENAHGDMRSALNALESYITGKTRNQDKLPIWSVVDILFSDNERQASEIIDRLDVEYGDLQVILFKLFDYVSEMVTKEKLPEEVGKKLLNDIQRVDFIISSSKKGASGYDSGRRFTKSLLSQLYIGAAWKHKAFIFYPKVSLLGNYAVLKKTRNLNATANCSARKTCLYSFS